MSLQRHREIYPHDEGTTRLDRAPAHRLDESPAGYPWRGAVVLDFRRSLSAEPQALSSPG